MSKHFRSERSECKFSADHKSVVCKISIVDLAIYTAAFILRSFAKNVGSSFGIILDGRSSSSIQVEKKECRTTHAGCRYKIPKAALGYGGSAPPGEAIDRCPVSVRRRTFSANFLRHLVLIIVRIVLVPAAIESVPWNGSAMCFPITCIFRPSGGMTGAKEHMQFSRFFHAVRYLPLAFFSSNAIRQHYYVRSCVCRVRVGMPYPAIDFSLSSVHGVGFSLFPGCC